MTAFEIVLWDFIIDGMDADNGLIRCNGGSRQARVNRRRSRFVYRPLSIN